METPRRGIYTAFISKQGPDYMFSGAHIAPQRGNGNHKGMPLDDSEAIDWRRSDMTHVKQWVRAHLDLRDDATVLVSERVINSRQGETVISVLRDDVHREWIIEKEPLDLTEADVHHALSS